MKQKSIPLNDMALFVEVGRALNFQKAALVTGIPKSTLSRRINYLEKEIGLRLFNRTTRKIEFTEAGAIYYDQCKPIIEQASLVHEKLCDMFTHPSGVIRASLPVDFTAAYIAPLLPQFCKQYPSITFDLDLSAREVDMVNDYFDLAIRIGEQKDSNLILHLLGKIPLELYASPQYIEQYGEPTSPADLANHECLTIIYNKWELSRNDEIIVFNPQSKFKLNNLGVLCKLVSLGMGVALIPNHFIRADLERGKLIRIMPEWKGMNVPVYAITESKLLPTKTKIFIEYLKQNLKNKSN